jgi:hypothetical protein
VSRLDKDALKEASAEVENAIDALNRVPVTYGGHLEKDGSSTIDGLDRDRVQHQDGRVLRFVRFLDMVDTPYLTALVTYRGRWLVVPAYKLRSIG